MKYLIIILLTFCSIVVGAQPEAKKMLDLIPANYSLMDSISVDFNEDDIIDKILIIESVEEKYEIYDRPRILLICRKESDTYHLIASNNSLVMKAGDGGIWGDPYAGMELSKGGFKLNFYGGSNWRWSISYQFRYQDSDFALIGVESMSIFTGDGQFEGWSYNFHSGKMKHTKSDSHEDKEGVETWHKLEIDKLIYLDDFVPGKEWNFQGGIKF